MSNVLNDKNKNKNKGNIKENQSKEIPNNTNLNFISPTISPDLQNTNQNVLNRNQSSDVEKFDSNDETEKNVIYASIDKDAMKTISGESNGSDQMKKPFLDSDSEAKSSMSSTSDSESESKSKEIKIPSEIPSENKVDLKIDLSAVDHDSNINTLSSSRLNESSLSSSDSELTPVIKIQPDPSIKQPKISISEEEEEEHETSLSNSVSNISSSTSPESENPIDEPPDPAPSAPITEGIDVLVENDDINFKRAKEICQPFKDGQINSIKIRNCELPNYVFNFISDKLETHSELKSIELSGCEVEISLLNLLGKNLHHWSNLEYLILSDNQFADYSLQTLIDVIKHLFNNNGNLNNKKQFLKIFDLSNCSIQENDFIQLIELINENARIEKYFFDGNKLSQDMFKDICKSLKNNTNVKLVSLKKCEITPDMVDQCVEEIGGKFKGKLAI